MVLLLYDIDVRVMSVHTFIILLVEELKRKEKKRKEKRRKENKRKEKKGKKKKENK